MNIPYPPLLHFPAKSWNPFLRVFVFEKIISKNRTEEYQKYFLFISKIVFDNKHMLCSQLHRIILL